MLDNLLFYVFFIGISLIEILFVKIHKKLVILIIYNVLIILYVYVAW